MKCIRVNGWLWVLIAAFVSCAGLFVFADDDEYEEREHEEHGRSWYQSRFQPPVNANYEETCGACHFAYPPGLLPEASWKKILENLADHNGESVEIDEPVQQEIRDYLTTHSADKSRTEWSRKIMRSIGSRVPVRITDIPYIKRKHHEVPSKVFKHVSVESRSNCIACHQGADRGNFDEDYVRIPR